MANPITGKTTTRVGAPLLRVAKDMARKAQAQNGPTKYRILNGFLLRALRLGKSYQGQVIDIPGFIMLKGLTYTGTSSPDPCVLGPARDDVTASAKGTDREVVSQSKAGNKYIPRPAVNPAFAVTHTSETDVFVTHEWQKTFFSNGAEVIPFAPAAGSGFYPIDSYFAFPRAMVVTITVGFTNFKYGAISTSALGAKANAYANTFWTLAETQLPSGWTIFPRRLVSELSYRSGANGDEFAFANYGQLVQFGYSWKPASDDDSPTPLNHYCVAAQICHQDLTLYKGTAAPTDGNYWPDYYDRYGQSALGVFFGSLDPTAWLPNGPAVYGQLDDQFMITVPDLPAYLQPAPVLLINKNADGSGLDIPRSGSFFAPRVLRCTGGFVVFSLYRCSQQESGTLTGSINITSVLTVLPDRSLVVLKADKSNWPSDGPTPDLPNFDPTHSTWPWVIGGFSVERTDANGNVTRTAYALIWEQWSQVQAGAFDRAKGEWSIYSFESGAPVRKVLTEDGASASTVASVLSKLDNVKAFPIIFYQNNVPFEDYKQKDYSSFCYAGDDSAVTPAIDKPFPVDDATTHDVKCAFIDLKTGVIQLRGVIAQRTYGYERFYITVAQPYQRADETTGKVAVEPVLIASSYDSRPGLSGARGKTWLSVDGGNTWNTYFTDSGADIGAYYVGNELWDYDPTELFKIL